MGAVLTDANLPGTSCSFSVNVVSPLGNSPRFADQYHRYAHGRLGWLMVEPPLPQSLSLRRRRVIHGCIANPERKPVRQCLRVLAGRTANSCCSCAVTPNGLQSPSARNDLISNTLTPGVPTSVVVKLLASSQATCNASTVTPASLALAPGLAAWGTTIHAAPVTAGTPAGTFGITETPFKPATLSPAELARRTALSVPSTRSTVADLEFANRAVSVASAPIASKHINLKS